MSKVQSLYREYNLPIEELTAMSRLQNQTIDMWSQVQMQVRLMILYADEEKGTAQVNECL